MNSHQRRIINEPNIKIEITRTTGRYAKSEVVVAYSGNIKEFDPDVWATTAIKIRNAVILAVSDIIDDLEKLGTKE